MCAFVLSVPSNSAKPGKEQGSMCLESMHIGRPIAALDRSPGTCASSQESFKNNCLAHPSKPVPQQPLLPPGGKKLQFQSVVTFRAPYTEQKHLTETRTWTCLWGESKDFQVPVFLSWSHILLLLVKTVKQYLQASAQHEAARLQHGTRELVLYTTVQPSGSPQKLCPSATKLFGISCWYFSIWERPLASNGLVSHTCLCRYHRHRTDVSSTASQNLKNVGIPQWALGG